MNNYRPITILPAISKFFAKVVCNQVTEYLDRTTLICDRQPVWVPRNQIHKIGSHWFHQQLYRRNGEFGDTVVDCFADLSKAFNHVVIKFSLKNCQQLALSNRNLLSNK